MIIQSHKGPYPVHFGKLFDGLEQGLSETEHLVIDSRVAELYAEILAPALKGGSVLKIEAAEPNKSLEKMSEYVIRLTENQIRRGHTLVAVGGGIIQDIVAFLAAILFRGVPWRFYPTTLLAQADSCIGSKSSINVGGTKNQVGTFTPPQSIHISTEVLATLTDADFRSGIGEMIKVHWIAGWDDFRKITADYPKLKDHSSVLVQTIRRSLEIKKRLVEKDEFDQKERLLLNYGHTFGHAIEGATHYEVPHGIAVTIGVDMSHYFSLHLGLLEPSAEAIAHLLLKMNFAGFEKTNIPVERFFEAILKDKKNVQKDISLILTRGPGHVFGQRIPFDDDFRSLCRSYFKERIHS